MLKHQAKPPPPQWGGVFPQGDDMSHEHQQEARRDELQMLRYSCIGPDEQDREYTRRDIQREKSLEYSIDEAYAAYEEMER